MKKTPSKKITFTPLALIIIFTLIIIITGFYAFSNKISKPKEEIYLKMKLSQGLWWSSSSNPPIWLADSIKAGDLEKDLFGNDIATVISKTYYSSEPLKFPNQYEVYITLKLATKKDQGTNKYRYKRNTLAVGSPINIDLSSATVTGSVMAISQQPFNEEYLTKKITLINQYGYYIDSPGEFDSIKIGDEFFDGQSTAFKITSKYLGPRLTAFSDINGRPVVNQLKVNQNIYIDAEIKVKQIDNMYFYGEEQRVTPGANLNIQTNSLDLTKFTVVSLN
jgi:hypothetical protein